MIVINDLTTYPMVFQLYKLLTFKCVAKGALWLSGRVLDSRPKGRGFEPHLHHCVVSLSKTHSS